MAHTKLRNKCVTLVICTLTMSPGLDQLSKSVTPYALKFTRRLQHRMDDAQKPVAPNFNVKMPEVSNASDSEGL